MIKIIHSTKPENHDETLLMVTLSTRSQSDHFRLTSQDLGLYAVLVAMWSMSWYPLKHQVGVIAPEVSLVWRFLLSSVLTFVIVRLSGQSWRFPLKTHFRLALLGILMFSTNFVLFYYAAATLASGLLPVIFSMTSIINLGLGLLFLGQRPNWRVACGALFGIIGISLVFWPEITGTHFNHNILLAVMLGVGGTISFACGNILSAANQQRAIPVLPATAWSMAYGAVFMALVAYFRGLEFKVDWHAPYLISLIWLTLTSSIVALLVYNTLIGRIGAARTGYATVIFPVFALLISTFLENFEWHKGTIAGVFLVLLGNVFVLSVSNPKHRSPPGERIDRPQG